MFDKPSSSQNSEVNFLIVTEVNIARKFLCSVIRSMGFQATGVESGTEVMPALLKGMMTDSPFTALMIDMQMKGMDSIRVLQDVRNNPATQNINVILSVSGEQAKTISSLNALGYNGYMVKPMQHSQIQKMLQENLGMTDFSSVQTSPAIDVLVAEDDEINQRMMGIILGQKGYQTCFASTGLEAIEAIKNWKFDIAFMDVHMPLMDGFETAKRIRAIEAGHSYLPIVALTASVNLSDTSQFAKYGIDAYLAKPYSPQSIHRIIELFVNRNHQATKAETEIGQVSETLAVLDFEAALPRFGNDSHQYHELLSQFMDTLPNRLSIVDNALKLRDWKAILVQAHNLKGILLNFGAARLATLMLQMENLCEKEQIEGIERLFIDIIEEIEKLKAQVVSIEQ